MSTPTQTDPAHAERSHHPTSPSSLQTLEASPCFLNRDESSEAAERGTKQHEAADSGEDDHELTDAEALAVAATETAVDEAVVRLGPDATTIREDYWPVDRRLIPDSTGKKWRGTTGGFADVVVVSKDRTRAEVLDWKFGKWSVETAENNLQGISYALGVFHRYRKMREVTVGFFSPHIGEFTRHTFHRIEVPGLLLRVTRAAERAKHVRMWIAKSPDSLSLYTMTTSACTFCARVGYCPKIEKLGIKVAKKYAPVDFGEIENDVRGFRLTDPEVAHHGLQLWGILGKGSAEYRKRVTAKAVDNPEFVPKGYKISMSYPREVCSLKGVLAISKKYLPEAVVDDMLSLPITKVEKAISAAAPRGSKESTVEQFAQELLESGAVVARTTPTIKLCMTNDKNEE